MFRSIRYHSIFLLLWGLVGHCSAQIFREVPASETKITWRHSNGLSDHRYLPETTGAGVALLDYNNDGWMDILFVNSGTAPFYKPSLPLRQTLYRNNHDGTFTDVTVQAGLTADIYGQGVAIGDYDGDGYPDIFIAGYGKCVLYHNNRDGSFTDVTAQSGIAAPKWGTSALWFDYDNDGKLDLFVGEFADYSSLKTCELSEAYGGTTSDQPGQAKHQSYYCSPRVFAPVPSHLYRNLGNGHFEDVSVRTGIASRPGKAWGTVATDINGDGFMDLFVANDTMANFLWMNRGGTKFEESGLAAGVGYSADGMPRSGMGVDAGDIDGDGIPELVVANIDSESTSLYKNIGSEIFQELNLQTGLAQATRMLSGWGLRLFDYDNDGWLDFIQSNGYPDDLVEERNRGVTYREPLLLFHNVNGTKLQNVSDIAGPVFQKSYSARGLTVGDLNNDGYPDVVFTENGGPPHVLMNTAASGNNWLGLDLKPIKSNPAAAGAVIRWSINGRTHSRLKNAGGSFLSSQDPREILGAGKSQVDWVEVQWPAPSHATDRIEKPAMNHYLRIVEGEHPLTNNIHSGLTTWGDGVRLLRVAAEDAGAIWLQAKAAMDQGDFATARKLLRQAVEIDPKDAALWFHLGVSCAELKEDDEAIGALEHARALAPRQADTYFDLGLIYWRKGNISKAKEAYRNGLTLRPKEPSALQNYSLLLMKTGEYQSAIAPLLALKDDPNVGMSSRVALIECYFKTGQQSKVKQETDDIMNRNVAGATEQTKLAAILLQDGDAADAERLLQNSILLDRHQANAHAALGAIYFKAGDMEAALKSFQNAIQLAPDSADYAFGYVRVLLAANRPQQLVSFLKSVEGEFGALPNYQYALGLAYYGEHHYSESATILEKLLASQPPRKDKVAYLLGNSYLALGKLSESENAYRAAIQSNPKDPRYYVSYAEVMRKQGPDKLDEAIAQLKSAQQMDPGDWRIGLQLGLCYESKGQFANAASLIEKAVEAQPELTPAHVALARVYFRLGRKADGERESNLVAELEKKQQEERVRENASDALIDEAQSGGGSSRNSR